MSRALETVAQRRFTVEEYHRMAETGILGTRRAGRAHPGSGSYQTRLNFDQTSRVAPEAWPELSFAVSALFPPPLSGDAL